MAAVRVVLSVVLAAASAAWLPALAQTSSSSDTSAGLGHGNWFDRGHGYLGLDLGRSHYGVSCASAAFICDTSDRSVKVTAGMMAGDHWGVELGYLDLGKIARDGGTTKAQGLNLSLVGRAPVLQQFSVYGKLGATYGRTETSTAPASGVAGGTERGVGVAYGAGLSWDFTPRLSATLEWDSNDFKFANGGREPVRSTSLGLQYRY
jgi:OmpA-OmpF porin, OOP family